MRTKFGKLLGSSILAMTAVAGTPALAQAGDEGGQASEASSSGEIIVTATRRAESSQKVSISMTVLDPAALANVSSPSDLAKLAPNIQLEQTSGVSFQRIGIRGVAQSDFNANATTSNMVYLDEVPMNAAIAQGVPSWDLERVEVLRGPQGTLFGRNATGGAIRYIAAMPSKDFRGDVAATIGRFNKREVRAAIGGPITEGVGLRLSFLSNQTDGWAFNRIRNAREGKDHYWGARAVLVLEPTSALKIALRAQYFKGGSDPIMVKSTPGLASLDTGFMPAADMAALQASYGFTGAAAASNFYTIENDMPGLEEVEHIPVSLNIDADLGAVTLTSSTGFLNVKQRFALDDDGTSVPLLGEYDKHSDRQWTQEVRLSSNGDGPLQWIVGGFYMHEKIKTDLYFDATEYFINYFGFEVPNGLYTRGVLNTTESYAAFGNATYQFNDKLKLTAGLRYTKENKDVTYRFRSRHIFATNVPRTIYEVYDFFKAVDSGDLGPIITGPNAPVSGSQGWDNVSFKLALDYQVDNNTLVYGSVSRGFKGGSFSPAVNFAADVLNPDGSVISVKPETVTSYEVGVKSQVIPRVLRVNASVFYYDYRNYQTNQFIAAIAGQKLTSLPKARIMGAEVEMRAEPVPGLVIQLAGGLTDSKIVDALDPALIGNKLPLAEDFNANGSISYRIETPLGSFTPEFSFKHRGKYFTNKDNDKPLGRYTTLDAALRYESGSKGVYGALWIRNLTDVRKPIAVDDVYEFFGADFAYISPPKTYGVTVGTRF